ncbi:hypothetical protein DIC82_17980 [Clostridium beijerinckii]|nr:hypothetical protein DIC82_17980 [Clostridium beijerinckii]
MEYMKRTFNSIGQGGFYTEKFNNFNMIFDCGSDTNMEVISQKINDRFDENEKINAIFISHFHDDHVNAIEHLLDYCNIERIFLPLLTEEQKVLMLLDSYCKEEKDEEKKEGQYDFNRNLIKNPEVVLGKTEIIYVKQDSVNSSHRDQSIDIETIYGEIESGTKITFENAGGWVFIPYNFQENVRAKQLQDEINREKIEITTINDFEITWRNNKDKIMKAYNSIKGDLNTNSMVIYSGLISKSYETKYKLEACNNVKCGLMGVCFKYDKYNNNLGCLYLGDYDASGKKFERLKYKYEKYWDKLGIIQLPHHGSKHNFNKEFLEYKKIEYIISAGFRNKFHHPHIEVVKEIYSEENITLHIVSEFKASEVYCRISWNPICH